MPIITSKQDCLSVAIEITKEYARGGGTLHPDTVLQVTYDKLIELAEVK